MNGGIIFCMRTAGAAHCRVGDHGKGGHGVKRKGWYGKASVRLLLKRRLLAV
jgi:hypothetical protein